MITKFKIYENLNLPPKIGNYVLMKSSASHPGIVNFINNNIGKIKKIFYDHNTDIINSIHIEYNPEYTDDLIGLFDYDNIREFQIHNLIYYSKYKKDVEQYILQKKFNL